jgi:hypothetical protein
MLTPFEDRMPFQKNGSSVLKRGGLVADVLKLDELLKRRRCFC